MEKALFASAAALGMGLTGLGAALAQGGAVAAALDGTARNPAAASTVRGNMILGLGMIESVVLIVLVTMLSLR